MKRRSPWLAFAACALVRTSFALAEPMEKPALSISGASAAAETELQKRGLAGDHVIASVVLVRLQGEAPFYTARIEPPIKADEKTTNAAPAPESSENPGTAFLAFKIGMNGSVSTTSELPQRRIRVIGSTK